VLLAKWRPKHHIFDEHHIMESTANTNTNANYMCTRVCMCVMSARLFTMELQLLLLKHQRHSTLPPTAFACPQVVFNLYHRWHNDCQQSLFVCVHFSKWRLSLLYSSILLTAFFLNFLQLYLRPTRCSWLAGRVIQAERVASNHKSQVQSTIQKKKKEKIEKTSR